MQSIRPGRVRIYGLLVFACLIVFATDAFSAIYKWTDGDGTPHFTDNENEIPLEYRQQKKFERVREVVPPAPVEPVISNEPAKKVDTKKETADKARDPNEPSPEQEKAAMKEAIGHFKSEAERNSKLVQLWPTELNGRTYVADIKSFLPRKKAMLKKLEGLNTPVLRESYGFLKASISEDEKVQVTGPQFRRRTQETQRRLKTEMGKANAFVVKINGALEQMKKDEEALKAKENEPESSGKKAENTGESQPEKSKPETSGTY